MSKELIDIAEKDRSEWSRTDYDFVKSFLKEKPWFSFGHFLITAIANEIGAYSYKSHLRSAALHAGKRQLLFKYLSNEDSEEVLKPVKEDHSQFAEITLNRPGEAQEIIPPDEKDSVKEIETLGEEIRLNINSELTNTHVESDETSLQHTEIEVKSNENTAEGEAIEHVDKEEEKVEEEKENTILDAATLSEAPKVFTPIQDNEPKVDNLIESQTTGETKDVDATSNNTPAGEDSFNKDSDKAKSSENKLDTESIKEEEVTQPKEKVTSETPTHSQSETSTEDNDLEDIQKVTNQEAAVYDPEKELLKLITEEDDPEEREENEASKVQENQLETADTHSFMQWLDMAKAPPKLEKGKKKKDKKKKKKKSKEKDSQDPLDHFLKTKPTISRPKREFYNPQNMAQKSDVYEGPITEFLAQLYVKQGEIETAIQMYEQLRLQDSSKSAYFASQIKQLKQR